jgi:hypothetical protein
MNSSASMNVQARRVARRLASPLTRHIERVVDRRTNQLKKAITKDEQSLQNALFTLDILLGPSARRSTRLLDAPTFNRLVTQLRTLTGRDDSRARLIQTYRMLVELEMRGVGRIAGGAGNILGKLAAVPMLEPANPNILEIGTLYGLFAGGLARQLDRIGVVPQMTIVDPLVGGQLQGIALAPDVSGSPVTEDVVRSNLRLAGVPDERLELIVGFSTDADIQGKLKDRHYGVIVLDGDHTYPGVANDLVLTERIAAPGCLVVMDDHGDKNWPDVEEATHDHLAKGGSRLKPIGKIATSLFLRAE